MNTFLSDTQPSMEALQIQLLRNTSPRRKLELLGGLNSSAVMLSMVGLRSLYRDESEERIRRRLANLLLGNELAFKVYGELNDVP